MADDERFRLAPLAASDSLATMAYRAIKDALGTMDLYAGPDEPRLDERRLSRELGVSRTPVRRALMVLEQEGFVRCEARRGVFVVRKSTAELVEAIHALTALESMAARLACARASDREIGGLGAEFPEFAEPDPRLPVRAYAAANDRFHRRIVSLSACPVLSGLSDDLLIHVRGIRNGALRRGRRTTSAREHAAIIRAMGARDAGLAERLVREHGLGLAAHLAAGGLPA